MTNSRDKGKRGELLARDMVREHWYAPDCIRAGQACGAYAADLLHALPMAHVEVKFLARHGAMRHLEQAQRDKGPGEFPVLLLRETATDYKEWLVAFRIQDTGRFLDGYAANLAAQEG